MKIRQTKGKIKLETKTEIGKREARNTAKIRLKKLGYIVTIEHPSCRYGFARRANNGGEVF